MYICGQWQDSNITGTSSNSNVRTTVVIWYIQPGYCVRICNFSEMMLLFETFLIRFSSIGLRLSGAENQICHNASNEVFLLRAGNRSNGVVGDAQKAPSLNIRAVLFTQGRLIFPYTSRSVRETSSRSSLPLVTIF